MDSYKIGTEFVGSLIRSSGLMSEKGAASYPIKKIIDGSTYNTSTATLRASWSTPTNIEEYAIGSESLYQTRTKKYFLIIESRFGYHPGGYKLKDCNDRIRGHVLLPLESDDAKKWAEYRDQSDVFSDLDEESDVNAFMLRMPPAMAIRLAENAKKNGVSRNDYICECLRKFI